MTFSPASFAALSDLSVAFVPPRATEFTDDELLATKRTLAEIRRRMDAADALVAAELAHRSRPELGHDGLAQRLGSRTPEKLIQQITGVSARDARTQVTVGALLTDEPTEPWFSVVGSAVSAGELSLAAAEAIRTGLGAPTADVSASSISRAAAGLVADARDLTVEQLGARARFVRTELDIAHVADREAALHAGRYLRVSRLPSGRVRAVAEFGTEDGAELIAIYDAITSPRRGGPRFVDDSDRGEVDALLADTRTTEQLAADAFLELLRLGARADDATFVGDRRPSAQLVVTLADLEAGTGAAYFEGSTEAVSIATAQRRVCNSGTRAMLFGAHGEVLDLGRDRRLYDSRQRAVLAVRDGGCMWPGCDRPPSWTEAHHLNEWARDHGRTDVADGILLCKHHHLLLHDHGWRITREGAEYFLVPPATLDAARTPRRLRSKSPIMARAGSQGYGMGRASAGRAS
jgi:hypothetical protein